MERRRFGKTGLEVSALGFGAGNVGGLMVRGTPAEQERAVARGLKVLRPNIILGTKFRLQLEDRGRIDDAITASLEASLRRLGLDRVDLFQLHNLLSPDGGAFDASTVLERIVPALERLKQQGK